LSKLVSAVAHHIMTASTTHPSLSGGAEALADRGRRAAVGLTFAALILGTWVILHITSVFFLDVAQTPMWLTAGIVAVLCWLYVGIFIVAHDCMHGTLAPGHPRLNRVIGQICVGLYAGFSFRDLHRKHIEHHRHSGTAEDPDFAEPQPMGFWPWYGTFMREYLTLRQMVLMAAQSFLYVVVLGASAANAAVFWIVPALLSSLQLFYFGTYLPHRPGPDAFTDHHRARSNGYPEWLSLLTCFHFGYHHEHHRMPGEPWWRLPTVRRRG
jgi:beta-carotene ketolase (CrtW type)